MATSEAMALLDQELERLRRDSYGQLAGRVDAEPVTLERIGGSGVSYHLEIQCFWDQARGGNVRVMVSVDDGGRRAFIPITESFIRAPDGSFVGE